MIKSRKCLLEMDSRYQQMPHCQSSPQTPSKHRNNKMIITLLEGQQVQLKLASTLYFPTSLVPIVRVLRLLLSNRMNLRRVIATNPKRSHSLTSFRASGLSISIRLVGLKTKMILFTQQEIKPGQYQEVSTLRS